MTAMSPPGKKRKNNKLKQALVALTSISLLNLGLVSPAIAIAPEDTITGTTGNETTISNTAGKAQG